MDGAVSGVIHVMSPTPKLCFATNSAISQAAVASVGQRRLAEAPGVSFAREAGLHVEGGIPAAVVENARLHRSEDLKRAAAQ